MRKSRILRYAGRSALMGIDLMYEGEHIHFNLFREIQINEETINEELKNQPTHYAFCTMLHKKLVRVYRDAEANKKKVWAQRYLYFKNHMEGVGNRPPSDDMVKAETEQDDDYQDAIKEMNKAEEDMNVMEAVVKSFEQRKDVIQSLSANLRKES